MEKLVRYFDVLKTIDTENNPKTFESLLKVSVIVITIKYKKEITLDDQGFHWFTVDVTQNILTDVKYFYDNACKYKPYSKQFKFGDDIINNLFSGYEILKEYKVLNYRVDWYIPELNIVIEFDEEHHKNQIKEDRKREHEIKNHLGCIFLRYDITKMID